MSAKYLTCAETAKLLRAALKAAHPGVKFSVRSSNYSGGASIDVYWTDGPTGDLVDQTAKLYQGSTFDGMTDMKSYRDTVLVGADGSVQEVHFAADHVFTHRTISPGVLDRLAQDAQLGGRIDRAQPCECKSCGNWMQPGNCYVAKVGGTRRILFVCSPRCVARSVAETVNV